MYFTITLYTLVDISGITKYFYIENNNYKFKLCTQQYQIEK